MINWIDVKKLNNQFDYDLDFNQDLNIFTGVNGCGKTTLLKLIWYLISGNFYRIVQEIPLESVEIGTDRFDLLMEPLVDEVKLEWVFENEEQGQTTVAFEEVKDLEINKKIANEMPGSLFFPTFRRLEGGFGAEPKTEELRSALSEFSGALSEDPHRFITAISTYDIVDLLNQKYTEISELENNTSKQIDKLDDLNERRIDFNKAVREFFSEKFPGGIKISEGIILGIEDKNKEPIHSNNLSSGEKQYLAFLSLVSFTEFGHFFLDEPELSLHVEVQRQLIEDLQELAKEKQFFIATHTPFIYGKYRESEIPLGQLRR